jgi:hypothetical protein
MSKIIRAFLMGFLIGVVAGRFAGVLITKAEERRVIQSQVEVREDIDGLKKAVDALIRYVDERNKILDWNREHPVEQAPLMIAPDGIGDSRRVDVKKK